MFCKLKHTIISIYVKIQWLLHEQSLFQGVLEQFDDLVFACGSGGTADGLALGNYLTGGKLR